MRYRPTDTERIVNENVILLQREDPEGLNFFIKRDLSTEVLKLRKREKVHRLYFGSLDQDSGRIAPFNLMLFPLNNVHCSFSVVADARGLVQIERSSSFEETRNEQVREIFIRTREKYNAAQFQLPSQARGYKPAFRSQGPIELLRRIFY